jgi:gliding motility-associated-like protein
VGGITLLPVSNAPAFTSGLDNGTNRENLSFAGLSSGDHLLHVSTSDGCQYDSLITILRLTNPEPEISAVVKDQVCFTNDGSLRFSFSGDFGPYQTSLNQGSYVGDASYSELAPASYAVSVRDKDGCIWDSLVVVKPYVVTPVAVVVDSVSPVCTELYSGSLTVNIEGDEGPYQYVLNGESHASGGTAAGLSSGDYHIEIKNKDGCIIDTMSRRLGLVLLPQCANVYVPTAFSPNGNGVNDRLRVVHDPYLTEVHLQVYNRYGGVVFSSSEANEGWDGSFQGVVQPAGMYVWKVAFVDHDKVRKTMQGTVLLIR